MRTANEIYVSTRSISGHNTERMQHHYSTVNAVEQREALALGPGAVCCSRGCNVLGARVRSISAQMQWP
jgi:hypothetical protein